MSHPFTHGRQERLHSKRRTASSREGEVETGEGAKDEEHVQLVKRIAEGDVAAWADLWGRLGPVVHRYLAKAARRPVDDPIVIDLASEVFDRVWSSASGYGGSSRVATWVVGIAKNTLFEHWRSEGRTQQDPDHEAIPSAAAPGLPLPPEQLEPLLAQLVESLPPAQRKAVMHRWLATEEGSDIPPASDAERQNLSRARKALLTRIATEAEFAPLRPWMTT
jgi:DNA-directed RNA polymerase specialized sigma24 family protein